MKTALDGCGGAAARSLVGLLGLTLLGSPSGAQETTAQGTTMGRGWEAPLVDTFFAAGGSPTLRTEAEIRESWASLAEDHKQKVRDDCSAFGTAETPAGESGSETPAPSGSAPPPASDDPGTAHAGSDSVADFDPSSVSLSSWTLICRMVEEF